jgi:hypothetical protein
MNRDDIIRMAREAGFSVGPSRDGPDDVWGVGANLTRFAALVAAAEREACAKVCDLVAREMDDTNGTTSYVGKLIRARGQL